MRNESEKKIAGEAAVALIQSNMTLGFGTGSTVTFFLEALGKKIQQGTKVRGIPTSGQTAMLCRSIGIELLDIHSVNELDLTIDGADEIDTKFCMIKGGGGALLREKIVAEISKQVVIIVDSSKIVKQLGVFPTPVEVSCFSYRQVQNKLANMGITATLRIIDGKPYITDGSNYILDCRTGIIQEPEELAIRLKSLTGVIDSGLFTNHCHALIVGTGNKAVFRYRGEKLTFPPT